MGDVARKVMGDVPISYIEGVGGTRVSEEDIVAVGKHDVSQITFSFQLRANDVFNIDPIIQGRSVEHRQPFMYRFYVECPEIIDTACNDGT